MKSFFFLFFVVFLIACESENESKYIDSKAEIPGYDTLSVIGQIGYFPFDSSLRDRSSELFPLAFSGTERYVNVGKIFSLSVESKEYLQFVKPKSDTFAFSFFLRNLKHVPTEGMQIFDLSGKAKLLLDASSGATSVSVGGTAQEEVINSYDSWVFVYVEIVEKESVAKLILKNTLDGVPLELEYSLALIEPLLAGEPIRIGSSVSLPNGINGYVDDLRFYNRSISANELNTISK